MDPQPSKFTKHRLAWFAFAILTLAIPFVWPVSIYVFWRLWAERKNVPAVRTAA